MQYLIAGAQSVMSSQPFSGISAGQDVPGASASSSGSGAAPTATASTPSSQLSPDLLSSLIAAQAAALGELTGSGHRHHHHGVGQPPQAASATSTASLTASGADDGDSASEGVQAAEAAAPTA